MSQILDVSQEGLRNLFERIEVARNCEITVIQKKYNSNLTFQTLIAIRNRLDSIVLPEGFEKLEELDAQDNLIEYIPDLSKNTDIT